jgi:translin
MGEHIRGFLEQKNAVRDQALRESRILIRHCSRAIRAVHRGERERAQECLREAQDMASELKARLEPYPDLYHAGYTQAALKELAEASIVSAVVEGEPLPGPEQLGVDYAAYLGGLGEAAGEFRRRILDLLRRDHVAEAEDLLEVMQEIYALLVTIDFPDAITGGLRRTTDMVRGVTERSRGDLTTSLGQRELKLALQSVRDKLEEGGSQA